MQTTPAFDSERIPVQTLKVITAQGEEQMEDSVHCPARERTIPLDDCLECHASDGFIDVGTQRFVRCRRLASLSNPGPDGASAKPPAASRTEVWEIMSRNAFCIRRADARADELIRALSQRGIQGVPVIDSEGRAVGMVSRPTWCAASNPPRGTGSGSGTGPGALKQRSGAWRASRYPT